jgi:hypothetical protein
MIKGINNQNETRFYPEDNYSRFFWYQYNWANWVQSHGDAKNRVFVITPKLAVRL